MPGNRAEKIMTNNILIQLLLPPVMSMITRRLSTTAFKANPRRSLLPAQPRGDGWADQAEFTMLGSDPLPLQRRPQVPFFRAQSPTVNEIPSTGNHSRAWMLFCVFFCRLFSRDRFSTLLRCLASEFTSRTPARSRPSL